jgi:biotin transporter BioY
MGKLIGILRDILLGPFLLLHLVVLYVLGLFWGPIRADSKESMWAILITLAVSVIIPICGIIALARWIMR